MAGAISRLVAGRPAKDAALRLRDRYWAISLKLRLPHESYASLERQINGGIHVRKRDFGQGFSQPFALSKVAAGTRGISSELVGTPASVQAAERLWPGSSAAFASQVWLQLHLRSERLPVQEQGRFPSIAVDARLCSWHVMRTRSGTRELTESGIARVGRLTHLDALATLLKYGSSNGSCERRAFLADLYVPAVYSRLRTADAAFAVLEDEFSSLIERTYPGVLRKEDPTAGQAFARRWVRAGQMMPF